MTSADNNTIKNLNLIGNATGRNIAGATSTAGSENTVYGVLATAGASTVSATTAPSAITSITTTIGSPATASNLSIDNNSIATVARGIAVQGSATTVFPGLAISNNVIGNPTASATDQVYSVGITAQGSANGVVSRNTVYVEGFLPSSLSAANRGIDIGGISATGTFTVERNQVNRVKSNAPDFWLAHGINLAGGNNHVVKNNFLHDITVNTTSGGFFSTTFNAAAIRVAAGTGHQIYHNSVNMTGAITGATNTITAGLLIAATSQTGVDARNNIFVNSLTGGGAGSAHVAVALPSSGSSTMNLTLNNNDYFNGAAPTATQGVGQVGTTSGTGFFTQANFDPSTTAGATNFRNYTSTLSAAGTNDNATKKVDPLFVSATDLHIAVASPMVDMGAAVGVSNDIDGQNRVPPPDIGADEPSGVTPPANDIAAVALVTPANGSSLTTGATPSPQASFQNVGSATQTSVGVQFTITGPGGYNYSNNQSIASIAPNQTIVVTFAAAPALSTPGTYNTTATVTTADANAANDSVAGTFTVLAPLAGSYNVPGDFSSLTNSGGIFAALNAAGASANIIINIAGDLLAETGANALNGLTNVSVLIRPTGAARTISGSFAGALIRFVGSNNIEVDGALGAILHRPNAALRNLTIINTSVSTPSVVLFGSVGTTPISNNTLKNCVIRNGVNTSSAVVISDGTTVGNPGFFSGITIQNNSIQRAFIGVYANGGTVPQNGSFLLYQDNDLSTTGANAIRFIGLYMQGVNNAEVQENDIGNFDGTNDEDDRGIWLASGTINAEVDGNAIFGLKYTGINGFGAHGIVVSTGQTGAGIDIINNMIYNLSGDGFDYTSASFFADNPFGIYAFGTQTGVNIYFNSINLSGNTLNKTLAMSAGIALGTGTVADVRDNAVVNNLGLLGATGYGAVGIWLQSSSTQLALADYNDYFVNPTGSGVKAVGQIATTASTTIANWRTATGKETNSISVNPLFISATNLHLGCGSPLVGAGTSIAGITNDFDNDFARNSPPAIGADEPVPPTLLSAVSSKMHGGFGPFTINLPLVGTPGIESRSTGGNHQIVFTFAAPVTVSSAAVTSGTGVAGAPSGNGTNTITVNLTGVANAQYITVTLCADDGTRIGSVSVTMGVLAGDVNFNGAVNGTDVSSVKLQSGSSANGGNFRTDVNAGGTVNGTDVSITKLASGTGLPVN